MTSRALKQVLFAAYNGFADKRIKNLDKANRFIVDNRGEGDVGADRKLFPWFCSIYVDVLSKDKVAVVMHGGVPRSAAISKWVKKEGGKETQTSLTFEVRRGDQDVLSTLARLVRLIVRPGAHYDVRAYKYVCPRVAASLDHVREVLEEAWSD